MSKTCIARIKTISLTAGGSAIFGLTGNEGMKWIKMKLCELVKEEVERLNRPKIKIKDLTVDNKVTVTELETRILQADAKLTPNQQLAGNKVKIVSYWLERLSFHLLHKEQWTQDNYNEFQLLQQDIWNRWKKVTGREPSNKIHMLKHCAEYARLHGCLGLHNESEAESIHSVINYHLARTHNNKANDPQEQLRRTHASTTLASLRP